MDHEGTSAVITQSSSTMHVTIRTIIYSSMFISALYMTLNDTMPYSNANLKTVFRWKTGAKLLGVWLPHYELFMVSKICSPGFRRSLNLSTKAFPEGFVIEAFPVYSAMMWQGVELITSHQSSSHPVPPPPTQIHARSLCLS